jgi:hypothetical protein
MFGTALLAAACGVTVWASRGIRDEGVAAR